MARLYDRIKKHGCHFPNPEHPSPFNDQTIIVETSNATRYWFENASLQMSSLLGLCAISPFDNCFMESSFSNQEFGIKSAGVFVFTLESKHNENTHYTDGYELYLRLFVEFNKRDIKDSGAVAMVYLDETGNIRLDYEGNSPFILFNPMPYSLCEHIATTGGKDEYLDLGVWTIMPFVFALTLMNTKNAEFIDHHPPSKLSKKHEKKYGEPLVTYKTIQVNPMRTVKRMDGDDVPSSERDTTSQGIQPLHIVAGNFADYRDGPGMFGNPKLKGVFWRPQHIRGNAERGAVVKDYEVQAPSDDG